MTCAHRLRIRTRGRDLPVVRRTKHLVARVRPALSRSRAKTNGGGREQLVSAVVDCPECGERRVHPLEVTVRARIDIDEWSYRFTCPTCGRRAVASTSRAAALEAVEEGSPLETWRWSNGIDEPVREGPPLSMTDLRALRVALSEPDWLASLSNEQSDR